MSVKKYKETDLYAPIKQMLETQGFTVKGEVKHCDIAAMKEDMLWIVEMKLSFNITLLYQAMERLAITPQVFVAIPRPRKQHDKNFRIMKKILKKLSLGLITVAMDSPLPLAEILIFPSEKPVKANKATAAVKREIAGRRSDTAGGVTKTVVNTAYRERSVKIACILENKGSLSASQLVKQYLCEKDTYSILTANYNGWFKKTGRGLFSLSATGEKYLQDNESGALIAYYRMMAKEMAGKEVLE